MITERNERPNQFALILIVREFYFLLSSLPNASQCDWNRTIVIVILKKRRRLFLFVMAPNEIWTCTMGPIFMFCTSVRKRKKSSSKSVNDLRKNCVFIAVEIMACSDCTPNGCRKRKKKEEWMNAILLMKNVKHIANDISKNTYH